MKLRVRGAPACFWWAEPDVPHSSTAGQVWVSAMAPEITTDSLFLIYLQDEPREKEESSEEEEEEVVVPPPRRGLPPSDSDDEEVRPRR